MSPNAPKINPLQRVLILTHEATEAVMQGQFEELRSLLAAREATITTLKPEDFSQEQLDEIAKAESLLYSAINRSKNSAVEELNGYLHKRKSLFSYQPAKNPSGYDLTG